MWRSLLGSTFFGLTSSHRRLVFSTVHDIVFHSNGGYDWHTVYNMPIWLRRFTLEKMNEHFENEKKQYESINKSTSKTIPKGPSIKSPTHTLKKSK